MPPSGTLADQIANKVLGRGTMYHAYSHIADKTKWIVALNFKWPPENGILVYAFFTRHVPEFKRQFVLPFEIGDYYFIKEQTFLDLTDIQRDPMEKIIKAYGFRYCGELKAAHLARADEIVAPSLYVSPLNRESIVGFRVQRSL